MITLLITLCEFVLLLVIALIGGHLQEKRNIHEARMQKLKSVMRDVELEKRKLKGEPPVEECCMDGFFDMDDDERYEDCKRIFGS